MKSVGTIDAGTGLWLAPNTDATNSSGFTGLPGGTRESTTTNSFNNIGKNGVFWSSTVDIPPYSAWVRMLFCCDDDVERFGATYSFGCYVRCVKD
jgi:uncharacterized protein (TIGR02145 family)